MQLVAMPAVTPKGSKDRLTKANELARKAMQFAATGVNIKEPVKRFIIELEARKDIPPKMLYSVFFLVAPWDQQVRISHCLTATSRLSAPRSTRGFAQLLCGGQLRITCGAL